MIIISLSLPLREQADFSAEIIFLFKGEITLDSEVLSVAIW